MSGERVRPRALVLGAPAETNLFPSTLLNVLLSSTLGDSSLEILPCPRGQSEKRFIAMDKDDKQHAKLDAQGDESTASGAARPSGNDSQKSVAKTEPAPSEKSARPGQLPDPNTEMVGDPNSPGRRPESTPETQRDSQAKV